MPILTLEKDGSIGSYELSLAGGMIISNLLICEERYFICPNINLTDVGYAVYVTDRPQYEVKIVKGKYATPFYAYLNQHFPGWKLKAT